MAHYILLHEKRTWTQKYEGLRDPVDAEETIEVFNSFETAKAEMRKAVTQAFADDEDLSYLLSWDGPAGFLKLMQIIKKTIHDPTYFYKGPAFDVNCNREEDDCIYCGDNTSIFYNDFDGHTVRMNVHNMTDNTKSYYFIHKGSDYVGYNFGDAYYTHTVRLLTDTKKKDTEHE